uniref:Reverse transcriptase domain-containing protein n=1 Tax=Oncorhynchus mykiss TaxID=8022 RepID=A0A8K9UYS7_ONCMY
MAASLRVPRKLCSFLFFYVLFLTLVPQVILGFITYSREELLNIRSASTHHQYDQEYVFRDADPVFCLTNRTTEWILCSDPKKRLRKRGKRGGLLVRLRRRAQRAPLPSILLANVQSLDNKVDEIRARVAFQRDIRDCNVLCFTETWLTGETLSEADQDVLLPGRLNNFFARFEDNTVPLTRPATKTCGLSFTAAEVSKTFKRVNPRKAAGPDGIPSRALRACADQLAGVFTDIFNQSLYQSAVPTCFKRATIVPVPKKAKVTELNDYRPVALTSVIMKCFERLVKDHITSTLPDTLDPLQFAYRPNRSTDDAISTTLHTALTHLDKRNTYVRMLFIDYSSAFNTIVPSKLVIKLETLGLDPALCNWVLDFLTGRPQVVRVGNNISSPLILNTGAPQGCVLSPLLYSLFTHDCVATHASNSIIKFADDTTVVGLITNIDETAYREEVRALGVWCQENNLTLNVNKTKEMIVDFRKQQREHPPIHIDGTVVERVASFKFLGIHITDKLNWSTHTDSIVKKAQQRLFNLRRLKKFGLSPKALTNFYRCTIESILAGCITAWYGNCTALNRKALQRVVRSAQRITGGKLPALQDTYTTRCHRKAIKIIKDINHPSHCLFTPLSSRRRGQYRCIKAGTERLKNSFYLKAIRLLNSHH